MTVNILQVLANEEDLNDVICVHLNSDLHFICKRS